MAITQSYPVFAPALVVEIRKIGHGVLFVLDLPVVCADVHYYGGFRLVFRTGCIHGW